MSGTPHEILLKYWGFESFRPLQEDIVRSVLAGKDTLALLPTGGGKSVCFQVPALCMNGLCLVVTPLVALMADQVSNLSKKGIGAVAVHSGMHPREISLAFEKCADGRAKFLYLSPERLDSRSFRDVAAYLPVTLIAVDEAHCISQWGYDFRPPYLRIAGVRHLYPDAPVLALTATAVSRVIDDIQEKLAFRAPNVFRKSFNRDNLAYVVYKEEDKLGKLLRICSGVKGSGIVYVRNRRLTKETAEFLYRNGVPANFYHAGLEPAVRTARQKEWMEERARVMVATNAFGMGIDKPNVRFVVHLDLPDTLEAYFQEAGRAGRDGAKSYAVVLFNDSDILDARHFADLAWPEPAVIRQVYQALGNYLQLAVGSGKDMAFDFDLERFATSYRLKPVTVFNVLKILERDGYLSLNDAMNEPPRVLVLVGKEELYKFQVENREQDRIIKVLLRSYSGLFSDFVAVNEYEIARRLACDREYITSQFLMMKRAGILDYIPQRNSPQLVFTTERLAAEDIDLSATYYFSRKKDALGKLEQLISYVSQEQGCRSLSLLEYFGDKSGKPCQVCDLCLKAGKEALSSKDFDQISSEILGLVKVKPISIKEVAQKIPNVQEQKLAEVIRWMIDEGMLNMEGDILIIKQ